MKTYRHTLLLPHISLKLCFNLQHSFIHLACAECDDSLPFSGASSIPLCYVLFPATLLHQLLVHPLSPHLAIYFLVYISIMLFPNSYILLWILFSSILCTCPNQRNLFNLIVSIIIGFLTRINFFIGFFQHMAFKIPSSCCSQNTGQFKCW